MILSPRQEIYKKRLSPSCSGNEYIKPNSSLAAAVPNLFSKSAREVEVLKNDFTSSIFRFSVGR
jgi:hypothetical protein